MSTIASGHLRTPHGDWFREGDASGAATQVTREFQAIAELSVIYASSPVNGRREFNDTHREARSLGLIQIRRSMRYTKITIVFATCLGIGIVSGGATASAKTQGAAAAACYNGAPDQNQGIFSDFTGELLGVVPIQCVEPVFGALQNRCNTPAKLFCPFIDGPSFTRTEIDVSRVRVYPRDNGQIITAQACMKFRNSIGGACSSTVSSSGSGGQWLTPSSSVIDDSTPDGWGYIKVTLPPSTAGDDFPRLRGFEFGD